MLPLQPRHAQQLFITSGENQILYIVHCLGLALFVQLVEVVQQGSLGGGVVLPRWCLPHWRGYFLCTRKGCVEENQERC